MSNEPDSTSSRWTLPMLRIGVVATGIFVVAQMCGVALPHGMGALFSLAFSLILFATGSAAFVWGFVVAAGRSRDEILTMSGVVWLTDSAPQDVAKAFRILLAVQIGVAILAAAVRPFSVLAFGILAPTFGVGWMTLYAARHGVFRPIAGSGQSSPDRRPEVSDLPEENQEDPDDFDQLFRRRKRS